MPNMNNELDWIDSVPINWDVSKMKYLFSFSKGLSITKENLIDEGLPVISYGQIHAKENSGVDIKDNLLRYVSEEYRDNNQKSEIKKYDFIFADTSEDYDGCGNCAYKRNDEEMYGGYHVVIAHSLFKRDNRFFAYLFQTNAWRKQIRERASGVKVFSITQKNIANASVVVPPENVMIKISDYLDEKCDEVDKLINNLKSQIDILEQYKKSIITEAVTKGIDKQSKLKQTNSEWIGEIPEEWDVVRIGHLFSMRNERNCLPEDKVQLLSLYTGIGVFPTGEHEARGNKAQTVDGYKVVRRNDIVVNIILAWMGAIGISEYDGVTSPAYDVYIPNLKKVVPHFYHYVFRTPGIAGECFKYGRGIMLMRWRTYSSEFKQIQVPFPPLSVQREIAKYLDEKMLETDKIIELKKGQIKMLEDYKQSIIFEYVTGKKEVPAV